ncbi:MULTISPECIES: DNA methyltransferase [unclassified Microbacterium]|uniref:DNA methyltransferase n=1 Tax=unclassified Microbacterium TaxID=2609290 RepID=UPI0036603C17
MSLHYEDQGLRLFHGSNKDVLPTFESASFDAVVTDPPYELGFMGKSWDSSGIAYDVDLWAECLRVLKPGGHLLAFGGTRTWHRIAAAIENAGFEIRDSIAWMYGSGFPKSRDVSAAMAEFEANGPSEVQFKDRPIPEGIYDVTGFLRAARDKAGWSNRQIDALFGTNGMSGHWTSNTSQPAVPSERQWAVLKEHLGFGDEMDELAAKLGSTERPEDWGTAEPSGTFLGGLANNPDAPPAGGWGTALKPAFEPVVVARKPVLGSTTANVAAFGTGAFNIDGCRVGSVQMPKYRGTGIVDGRTGSMAGPNTIKEQVGVVEGRFPPNVLLDESQGATLDAQSGAAGASRFFPIFRYEAKAPTSERPNVDGTAHATVKPLDLMRWLVRLVTPRGGHVLDPFAGSGTTGEAALLEGMDVTLIELEEDHLPLILQRVRKPLQPAMFGDWEDGAA